jgi:hypothetical protein
MTGFCRPSDFNFYDIISVMEDIYENYLGFT